MATFKFELVSPERLVLSTEVDQVDLPGVDGDFGVLANHSPFLSTLRAGIVAVRTGSETTRIFVRGGFADVSPAGLTVLAETAIPVAELKPDQIAAEIRDAEEDVADAKTPDARTRAEQKLAQLRDVASALQAA
ncbi:F0F1 ATP synthase subunit epsilon [Chthonobacter rhizosphaerae]|uniref:F0F1 ATP synthase subunit epsilon n=1 Tax=Chthonobacter rhizosphaerae TaxID=2735553 RepID=UPI0015EF3D60|nr:F0F1 ATP synthase subunit epsilon [Chthonobacter rhizosphaerae]